MANFEPRTTAPDYNNPNYPHGSASEGQCTYGVYYRCKEIGWPFPCHYYSGVPGYGDAKDWPENANPQWEVHYISKEPNYIPIPGDICVFNGTHGHVIFIEERLGGTKYRISQWNKDSDGRYSSDIWNLGEKIIGRVYPTGPVKAYMHYKLNYIIEPVAKNTSVDQLEVIKDTVYMRNEPGLSGIKLGFAIPGFYNTYNAAVNDGYTWYKISSSNNIWIAEIIDSKYGDSTKFHPASCYNSTLEELRNQNEQLTREICEKNQQLNTVYAMVDEFVEKWSKYKETL